MSNVENVLSARVLGEVYPVSVGTDPALQTMAKGGKMDVVWVNVATLVRNVFESVGTEERGVLTRDAVGREVQREMSVITEVASGVGLRTEYYILGYEDLGRKYPFAKLRTAKTELQQMRSEIISGALDYIMAHDEGQRIHYDKGSEIKGEPKRALLISHYATDLLSKHKFATLRLLESYTGTLKTRPQWNSKLTDGKTLPNIPFNYWTVQIFGDNRQHFDPYPRVVRVAIMELAAARNWTSITTIEKIRFSIERMKDQYTAKQLLRAL